MKENNILITIIIVVVLIVSGGSIAFFSMSKSSNSENEYMPYVFNFEDWRMILLGYPFAVDSQTNILKNEDVVSLKVKDRELQTGEKSAQRIGIESAPAIIDMMTGIPIESSSGTTGFSFM